MLAALFRLGLRIMLSSECWSGLDSASGVSAGPWPCGTKRLPGAQNGFSPGNCSGTETRLLPSWWVVADPDLFAAGFKLKPKNQNINHSPVAGLLGPLHAEESSSAVLCRTESSPVEIVTKHQWITVSSSGSQSGGLVLHLQCCV